MQFGHTAVYAPIDFLVPFLVDEKTEGCVGGTGDAGNALFRALGLGVFFFWKEGRGGSNTFAGRSL